MTKVIIVTVHSAVVGPTSTTQDEAPVADESKPNTAAASAPGHDSYLSMETVKQVSNRTTDSNEACLSAAVQPERAACLTTIAEADSSIRTSPCEGVANCANEEPLPPCVNTTTTTRTEGEGAVSSTKFDSCPMSSLDTMQSVSILPSQDCLEQQCDVAPDIVHDEDKQKGARKGGNAHSQDMKANELIATESYLAENQEEPLIVCKEKQTSGQSIGKRLPPESMPSYVKDPPMQSLDFHGLVSLFDDSSLPKPTEVLQKAEETVKAHPDLSRLGKQKTSPIKKGRDQEDALDSEPTESDLYERVKQRQRRRTSEVSLQSNRFSDPPKKSLQLKTKTKKRSADSVAVVKQDEPSPDGNARKKLKTSWGSLHHEASPLMVNTERSQEGSAFSSRCKEKKEDVHGSGLPCEKDDDHVEDSVSSLDSRSCASGSTVLSNEMVPASVSSSEKSISTVINPMIAHVNQAVEAGQESTAVNTEEWGSETIKGNSHDNIAKNRTGANEESPQIKPVWNQKRVKNNKPIAKEEALQDEESVTKVTTSVFSSSRQEPFVKTCQVDDSKQNTSPKGKGQTSVHVKDAYRGGSSQVSVTRHQESQPFDPSEKELLTNCDQMSQLHEQPKEHRRGRVDIHDTQGLPSEFATLQASDPEQKHLKSSFNERSQKENISGETGITRSQMDGKLSNVSVGAEGKTSEQLNQEGDFSGDTPTQSSLELMDAVTPRLFGNDSWETPDKKTGQKKSGNQRDNSNNASAISENDSKIAARSSRTPLGMSGETVTEKERIVDKAGFDRVNSLDGSQDEDSKAEQQLFSGVTICPDGNNRELVSDTDPEGTQSFGTSQSISVLQDLEFPPQEHQQEEEDVTCSEEREGSGKPLQSLNTATNSDAPWKEPLPKKPRSTKAFSSSCEFHSSVSLEQGIDPAIAKACDSEYIESSDVIPPTPPVKTVTKQVFSSRTPLGLSRPKMRLQRKDGVSGHSERLVVKQKRRAKSPRVLKSTKSQDSEWDRAGTRCNSVGSESAEDSVSLLKNHGRSLDALDLHTMDLSPAADPDSNKQVELSQARVNKLENVPCESPRGTTNSVKPGGNVQKIKDVSSENENDPSSLQEIDDNHVSQKEKHGVIAKSKETKSVDVVDRPSRELHVEGVDSSPRSSIKRRVYDIEDSFDWSGTKDGGRYNQEYQNEPETLYNGDNEDDQDLREDSKKDENGNDSKDDFLEKRATGNLHETDDRDCILVDDDNRDFPCTDDGGDSPCITDEGGSSSDEALLKPVFLPKECESSADVRSCKEDAENEEEEVAAFSQELITSENEGEDDDDGIACEYYLSLNLLYSNVLQCLFLILIYSLEYYKNKLPTILRVTR